MKYVISSILAMAISVPAVAAENLTGRQIVEKVNARDEGQRVSRKFDMKLTDRRGVIRTQKTIGFRKYFGEEKRTIIFYSEPKNVRGTGFLTYDYPDSKIDDDQWLYLPALRKVRRISASDRGDYFLGTDLTYEEIKKEGKFEIEDYTYRVLGKDTYGEFKVIKIELIPVNEEIAKILGYSKIISYIDPEIWMSRKGEYWDTNNNHLKTIENRKIQKIDGIWTTTEIYVKNHKTKHQTLLNFYEIDYRIPIKNSVFTQRHLKRGLR